MLPQLLRLPRAAVVLGAALLLTGVLVTLERLVVR